MPGQPVDKVTILFEKFDADKVSNNDYDYMS